MKANWKVIGLLVTAGSAALTLIGSIAEEKSRDEKIRETVREVLAEKEEENDEES